MEIREDDLSSAAVIALIREHLHAVAEHSPPESVHALDLAALRAPEVTFWTAWEDGELLGCGALQKLEHGHGEIKSMRTAAKHLRKGVAAKLLEHIVAEARRRGYTRLSLETGAPAAFAPARALYRRYGFRLCEPFADYRHDPYSVFMTRTLD